MIYLALPDNTTQKLPFYLAMEEYAASLPCLRDDDIFFMWRVAPTVIFGRCQIGSLEVNLPYCQKENIDVYRRKSGGGCVYADFDNIMFSYITSKRDSIEAVFSRYTEKVKSFLSSLGLDATATSRNDIIVDGKKVSGNAYYNTKNASIVHGTMLFSTNLSNMLNAITPSKAKLDSKGVTSVESRITTLDKYLDFDIQTFITKAKEYLCDKELDLNNNDIKIIEEISKPYYDYGWRFGLDIKKNNLYNKRIEGIGDFYISTSLDSDNHISNIELAGDFFVLSDITELLIKPLLGSDIDKSTLLNKLKDVKVNNVIDQLSNEQYINLIIESCHE